jgi:hypothetical protein
MKNKILIALFTVMTVATLQAQDNQNNNYNYGYNYGLEERYPHLTKNYTIAFHPFSLFTGGMRFDLEKRIKNTPAWVQIGLTGNFLSRKTDNYNNYFMISGDEMNFMLGGCLNLNYKRFYNRKESLYFAGGCLYSHYNIEHAGRTLHSYIENDLTYYAFKYGNVKQKIDRFGLNAFLGYQSPRPTFLFDVFAGIGYRYSFRSNNQANPFNNSMVSLGYRGFVFVAGIRFGVKFNWK